ncbi:hypothetical protein BDV09DRAFT_65460 [Aspergillus tetrazonus]
MSLNMIGRSARAPELQRAEHNVVCTRSSPRDTREYPISVVVCKYHSASARRFGSSVRREEPHCNLSLVSGEQTIVGRHTKEVLRARLSMPVHGATASYINWRITLVAGRRFTAESAKNQNDYEQYQKLLRFVGISLVAIVVQASLFLLLPEQKGWIKRVRRFRRDPTGTTEPETALATRSFVHLSVTGSKMSSPVALASPVADSLYY